MKKTSFEIKKAPAFELPDSAGEKIKLEDFIGKYVVLYFYPKDNTPGCTVEAIGFRDLKDEFEKLGAVVIGVSKDSAKSHEKFIQKNELNFILLSDEEGEVLKLYDVLKPKKMFGKEYLGIERSTFVIDKNGDIVKEYRKVKAPGHAEVVLEYVGEISKG